MRNILCSATFLMILHGHAAALVIEDFTVGPVSLVRDSGVPVTLSQSGLDGAHVVGGRRDFELGESGGDGQSVVVDTMTGQLVFDGASSSAGYLNISYGTDVQPLGLDLLADGSNHFLFDFDGPNGFYGRLTLTSPGVSQLSNIDTDPVLYSEFPAVDFSNISSIKLDFFRSPGFVLNSIHTAVPEPGAGALLSFGILGALVVYRRRR